MASRQIGSSGGRMTGAKLSLFIRKAENAACLAKKSSAGKSQVDDCHPAEDAEPASIFEKLSCCQIRGNDYPNQRKPIEKTFWMFNILYQQNTRCSPPTGPAWCQHSRPNSSGRLSWGTWTLGRDTLVSVGESVSPQEL